MPPSPIRAASRSRASALPVGCVLNNRTCAMVAAPTNPVSSLNWGQASMQQQQEMHRERGYAASCSSADMRGPAPRSYVPSIGTHAFTAFRFSKITLRSTARSRTTGNLENGSSFTGCSRLSIRAEQAMRARPLMSIAQEPQTSSRQFESYVIGVVALPSRVTGLAAISMSEEITFMPGWWASSNSSQYGLEVGVFWRLIFSRTDLLAISLSQLAGPFEHLHGRRQRVASSIPTDRKPTPQRLAIRGPGALPCCACRSRATGHTVLSNTMPAYVTPAFDSVLEFRQT